MQAYFITYIFILSFIFGAIMGSFLLVVSLRYNTGKSLQGRSQCFSCNKSLEWYELIPIVSYLSQKGRCRKCSSSIPLETLGAEVISALVFSGIAMRGLLVGDVNAMFTQNYLIATFLLFLIFSILLVIFFYDIRHKIIPDHLSFLFALIAFIASFFFGFLGDVYMYQGFHIPDPLYILGGILVPLPFALIWLFSKGRMIGLGDPKLMVGIGFLLGTLQGFSAVFVSFWIATLVMLTLIILGKVFKISLFENGKGGIMKQEVPFGPFLVIGLLVTILLNINLL